MHIIELYDTQATKRTYNNNCKTNTKRFSIFHHYFAFSGHGTQQGLKLYDQDISIQEYFNITDVIKQNELFGL